MVVKNAGATKVELVGEESVVKEGNDIMFLRGGIRYWRDGDSSRGGRCNRAVDAGWYYT